MSRIVHMILTKAVISGRFLKTFDNSVSLSNGATFFRLLSLGFNHLFAFRRTMYCYYSRHGSLFILSSNFKFTKQFLLAPDPTSTSLLLSHSFPQLLSSPFPNFYSLSCKLSNFCDPPICLFRPIKRRAAVCPLPYSLGIQSELFASSIPPLRRQRQDVILATVRISAPSSKCSLYPHKRAGRIAENPQKRVPLAGNRSLAHSICRKRGWLCLCFKTSLLRLRLKTSHGWLLELFTLKFDDRLAR